MKCTNRNMKRIVTVICILTVFLSSGCGATKNYSFAYDRNRNNTSFSVSADTLDGKSLDGFSSSLCVENSDVILESAEITQAEAVGLFDINDSRVIYAKNIHEQINPASITKILTALCAIKYGNLNDVLTASENVHIEESGAVLLGVETGDKMTLDQALYCLMLKSANDVAIMIAEHVSGSVEAFAELMNQEANSLGATNSHFVNPNGLTDPNHYTTVYDLYLICNEAVKYDKFVEVLHTTSYNSVYYDKNQKEKTISISTTNAYLKGEAFAPNQVTVIGGKTGTTQAAGSCLLLYSKDTAGNPYISIVMKSSDRTTLYKEMTEILQEIS